jgi:hypothetical protein
MSSHYGIRRKFGLTVCALMASWAHGATVWNEAVQGDLSGNQGTPTTVNLSAGNNDLFATTQGGDLEFVTFTVPAGGTLTSLFVRTYTGFDSLAFLGMQRGATFTESPSAPNVANLLGWTHFGPGAGNVGADILPSIGAGPGAQGFTPPLSADSYTLWLQQLGSAVNYQLDLVVSPPAIDTWNVDADGDWTTATNWSPGVPHGAGAQGLFGGAITAPRTVAVNLPVTVGRIDFDSTNAYTIAGPSALTLDAASGAAMINVVNGSHTLSGPLTLADDLQITVTPAASNLSLGESLQASGRTVTKAGAGSLTVSHLQAASLTIDEGAVRLAVSGGTGRVSLMESLSIAGNAAAPAARFDLSDNAVVLDYTDATPAAAIRGQLIAGRGGSGLGATWTGQGITSSTAAAAEPESRSVGYAENASLPLGPNASFRGQTVDDTSLLMAYTRTGDANLDGVVNDDDVTIVSATYAPGVPQPNWALGDFDYNGFVDDDDVTLLGVFYDPAAEPIAVPAVAAPTRVTGVPEPSAVVSAMCAVAAVLAWVARRGFSSAAVEHKS